MARATRVPPALPHHRNGTLRSHVGSVGRAFFNREQLDGYGAGGYDSALEFSRDRRRNRCGGIDLQLVSTVATGNKIATTGSAAANVGALLALFS